MTDAEYNHAVGRTDTIALSSYADYFSTWYGLKNGTVLPVSNKRGSNWVRLGNGKIMTAFEFNAQCICGSHEICEHDLALANSVSASRRTSSQNQRSR